MSVARQHWRKITAAAVAIVVVLALAFTVRGFGGEGGKSSNARADAELDAMEGVAGVSAETGLLSKTAALRLFEMTFGDVPGVEAAEERPPVESGTAAVRGVMAHFDEYTAEQRQAIRRLLEPPPGSVAVTVPPVDPAQATAQPSMMPIAFVRRSVPHELVSETVKTAAKIRADYASDARLGFDVPNLTLLFAPAGTKSPRNPGWVAWTGPREPGSPICDITLPEDVLRTRRNVFTLAHEIFHCFQSAMAPNNYRTLPGWVADGSAEYAASEVQSIQTSTWWGEYATTPNKHLFTRMYDALGFYAHLREIGINPYTVIPAMVGDGTNLGAYEASGATSERFLDSWASGYFRGAVRGDDWKMTGPGLGKSRHKATPVRVDIAKNDMEGQPIRIGSYANAIYRLRTTADVVEIEADPESHVRISDGTTDAVVLGTKQFCTRPDGCVCPSGGDSQERPTPLHRAAALAIGGGTNASGSSATVRGVSLTELCCAGPSKTVTAGGLTIKPRVDCQKIGLKIERDDGPKLNISFALFADHPHLLPHFSTRDGKKTLAGVELQGINGILVDFAAGAANWSADNKTFDVDVPVEVEVPVRPRVRGLPASMKIHWKILIRTAITGDNSTIWARGQYGLAGPVGVRDGTVAEPSLSVHESMFDTLGGVTLGPSGIVITVYTRFTAGAGTSTAMTGTFAALTASVGVTNGSSLGSPLIVCQGVDLDLVFGAGGGRLAAVTETIFSRHQVVPDVALCNGG